jgi:hypothetical protein
VTNDNCTLSVAVASHTAKLLFIWPSTASPARYGQQQQQHSCASSRVCIYTAIHQTRSPTRAVRGTACPASCAPGSAPCTAASAFPKCDTFQPHVLTFLLQAYAVCCPKLQHAFFHFITLSLSHHLFILTHTSCRARCCAFGAPTTTTLPQPRRWALASPRPT